MEHLMFEAADPKVFEWYIKNYGADVNLFVDHSQICSWNACVPGFGGQKVFGDAWCRTRKNDEARMTIIAGRFCETPRHQIRHLRFR